MKKIIFISLNLMLLGMILYADAAPVDVLPVERVIKISNCSKVPGVMILAIETDESGDNQAVYEIKDNTALDVITEDRTVYIMAVKRSLVEQEGLNNLNFRDMVLSGEVSLTNIAQPFYAYRPDYSIDVYYEEIIYRISGIASPSNKLFLQIEKKIIKHKDGKELNKELTRKKDIRNIEKIVGVAEITSTSYLKSDIYTDRYHPLHVFDGDPETGWSEDATGAGVNEKIEVVLAEPTTVDKITIMPGWFQKEYFKKNNRIKKMEIKLDNFSIIVDFKDSMIPQDVVLKSPKTFTRAQFIIKEVYKTGEWDDTPLAEVQFFYQKKEIVLDTSNIGIIVSAYDVEQ